MCSQRHSRGGKHRFPRFLREGKAFLYFVTWSARISTAVFGKLSTIFYEAHSIPLIHRMPPHFFYNHYHHWRIVHIIKPSIVMFQMTRLRWHLKRVILLKNIQDRRTRRQNTFDHALRAAYALRCSCAVIENRSR